MTPAVIEAIQAWRAEEPPVSVRTLVERVAQRFQGSVHPRSIERTLARRPQKGGTTQVDQVDQRSAIHLP